MSGYERTLAVKEAAEARLRTLPGVHAVGVGLKSVRGEPTEELCIVVFLERKRPLERLLSHQVVPAVIDGVKTDVVEMAMPRQAAGDPAGLTPNFVRGGTSVEFGGLNKPGAGLLVVLTCTSGPKTGPPSTVYVHFETADFMTVDQVAQGLVVTIMENRSAEVQLKSGQALGFTASLAPGFPNRVLIEPTDGNTCAIQDCQVTAVDDEKYFKDHVRGGIQIEPGGKAEPGTLGCLATTKQGLVVALTCQHVVAQQQRQATNLGAQVKDGTITLDKPPNEAIQEGSLVVVGLWDDHPDTSGRLPLKATAFYTTLPDDTLVKVAGKLADTVTGLNLAGISGQPADSSFTVTGAIPTCAVFGPPPTDPHLGADVSADVSALTITLSGSVAGDDYGIFTNVNAGGTLATFGVFYQPAKNASLSEVAKDIAAAISQVQPDAVRGSVTATSTDVHITVHHAQQVECFVLADCRVGQPLNHFCSRCSPCCSDRIGRVLAARIDVDTALIQLDAGREYKTELVGKGMPPGVFQQLPPNQATEKFLGMTAWKLGRTTRLTMGRIDAINVSGLVVADASRSFHRSYTNAMSLTAGASTPGPYALPGDSGAAVFTPGGSLLGILFSSANRSALMTPMSQIIAAFPDLALNVAPAPTSGKAPQAVGAAPAAATAAAAPAARPAAAATPSAPPTSAVPALPHAAMGGSFGRRLAQVEAELTATPAGAAVAAAVRRHFDETERLVNTNRRVATVWHRSGGPQIVQAVLDLLRAGRHLPREIDGRPLADCLERIGRVLARHASPALGADVARHGPRLARFSGLTYAEILAALQAEAAE